MILEDGTSSTFESSRKIYIRDAIRANGKISSIQDVEFSNIQIGEIVGSIDYKSEH